RRSTLCPYTTLFRSGYAGTGNISSDPMLANVVTGDLHLHPGSPCIDAASNGAVPADVTTDADGLPRFVDDPATADTGSGTAPIRSEEHTSELQSREN